MVARLQNAFIWLDAQLIAIAGYMGMTQVRTRDQLLRFMSIYAGLYFLGSMPLALIALPALTVAYVGVIAVGRAWVANEKERLDIARFWIKGDPDQLPDLRVLSLVSALQLIIIFPLFFAAANRAFHLYTVEGDVSFVSWLWFTVDKTYMKALPDWTELYSIHITSISADTDWGRHLIMFSRLTFNYILFQGILRLWAIFSLVRQTMRALEREPAEIDPSDIAALLGLRAVKPLVRALKSPTAGVRRHAAQALGKLRDDHAVTGLIQLLKDPEPAVRCAAVISLGQIDDRSCVEMLLVALRDPEPEVRQRVARVLGEMADPRAGELLLGRLRDESQLVRAAAARSLGALKERKALETLIEIARDDQTLWTGTPADGPSLRVEATLALGKIAAPEAFDVLREALMQDDDISMSAYAAWGLGQIGNPDALVPLLRATNSPHEWVRRNAVHALGVLGDPNAIAPLAALLHDPEDSVRSEVELTFRRLGADPENPPSLLPLLKSRDAGLRIMAINGLAQFVEPEAVPLLLEIAEEDKSNAVCVAAITTLGVYQSKEAIPYLLKLLKTPGRQDEVDVAVLALASIGEVSAVQPILTAWKKRHLHSDAHAIEALGELGDPSAIEPIMEFFAGLLARKKHHDGEAELLACVVALGELKASAAVDLLMRCADDHRHDVRSAAAKALGLIGDTRAVEELLEMLVDAEPDCRAEAAAALGRIGDARAVPALLELLADDMQPDVRGMAIFALGKLGDARALEPMLDGLGQLDGNPRLYAIAGLGFLRDPGATYWLLNELFHESPSHREFAAQALGRIADPRSVVGLKAAMTDENEAVVRRVAEALATIQELESRENSDRPAAPVDA